MTTYVWTDPVVLSFVAIPVLLVAALLAGVSAGSRRLGEPDHVRRRAMMLTAVVAAAWMGATWTAGASGVLRNWDTVPPPFAFLVLGILILAALVASGGYGRRLADGVPLWILVGVQGFRLPLEVAMHAMYERGIMPVQMSYSGRNFDIVTGIAAIIVAAAHGGRAGPRTSLLGWNLLGLCSPQHRYHRYLIYATVPLLRGQPAERVGDVHALRLAASGDGAGGARGPSTGRKIAFSPSGSIGYYHDNSARFLRNSDTAVARFFERARFIAGPPFESVCPPISTLESGNCASTTATTPTFCDESANPSAATNSGPPMRVLRKNCQIADQVLLAKRRAASARCVAMTLLTSLAKRDRLPQVARRAKAKRSQCHSNVVHDSSSPASDFPYSEDQP